jgi:hypothetical protein
MAAAEAPDVNDGAFCANDGDCSNGLCATYRLCAHSACDCPGDTCTPGGELAPECRAGWVCVGYSLSDPIVETFDTTPDANDGHCQPPCAASCPEHYLCQAGMCVPDITWVNPVVSIEWAGALVGRASENQTLPLEEGRPITLTASASSPLGLPLRDFEWALVTGSPPERLEAVGSSVELEVEPGSYARAELTARDEEGHTARLDLIFEACHGRGTTCGYEGSGCCDGCNRDTNACL